LTPEQTFRSRIDKFLYEYFNVQEEVYSVSGRRIDYILQCKASHALFGLEVKHNNHMRGVQMGEYLLQAHDYSKHLWKTRLVPTPAPAMIFIAPALSNTIKQIIPESLTILPKNYHSGIVTQGFPAEYYQAYHQSNHIHSNVNSFLAAFHVGEVRKIKLFYPNGTFKATEIHLIYNNHIIWRQFHGLHQVNYDFYINR
jgi:hypothetical protein